MFKKISSAGMKITNHLSRFNFLHSLSKSPFFSTQPPKNNLNDFLNTETSKVQPEKVNSQEFIDKHFQEQLEKEQLQGKQGATDPNRGSFYMFTMAGVALLTIFSIQKLNEYRENAIKNKKKFSQKHVGKPDIGGEWELEDINNKTMTSHDLRNTYYIIYFGFCNCPDICPASLTKLSKAYENILQKSEKNYFKLKIVFVSVDPDRDTPEKVQRFIGYFNKKIIGVSGKSNDDPKLKEMLKKFKIYSTRMDFETTDEKGEVQKGYTYDHTVISYLMSDTNEYLTHLGSSLGVKDLSDTITDHIMEDIDRKRFNFNRPKLNIPSSDRSKGLQEITVK